MSYFDGIEKTKIFESGVYLQPDQVYKLKLQNTKVIKTREKGHAFIADFEVLESSTEQDPVGSTRNLFVALERNVDTAFSNVCALLIAAMGIDYSTPEGKRLADTEIIPRAKALLDDATTNNSLAGKVVRCVTSRRTSKQGREYTRNQFSPA